MNNRGAVSSRRDEKLTPPEFTVTIIGWSPKPFSVDGNWKSTVYTPGSTSTAPDKMFAPAIVTEPMRTENDAALLFATPVKYNRI